MKNRRCGDCFYFTSHHPELKSKPEKNSGDCDWYHGTLPWSLRAAEYVRRSVFANEGEACTEFDRKARKEGT